jgi:hypothetical protein
VAIAIKNTHAVRHLERRVRCAIRPKIPTGRVVIKALKHTSVGISSEAATSVYYTEFVTISNKPKDHITEFGIHRWAAVIVAARIAIRFLPFAIERLGSPLGNPQLRRKAQ